MAYRVATAERKYLNKPLNASVYIYNINSFPSRNTVMKILLIVTLCLLIFQINYAQVSIKSGDAFDQIENFANQVSNIYKSEYTDTIPNIRCAAKRFSTQAAGADSMKNCRLVMIDGLNKWNSYNIGLVWNYYVHLAKACGVEKPAMILKTVPNTGYNDGVHSEIDMAKLHELKSQIDATKVIQFYNVQKPVPPVLSGY